MEKNLGELLKQLRKENKCSQEELSNKLMVSRQTISKWENNKSLPDIHTLKLIADFFDVSLDYFIKENRQQEVANNSQEITNRNEFITQYTKYLLILVCVFALACTLPRDIAVPVLFFGKLLIIFFVLLLMIYFIIKKYLR